MKTKPQILIFDVDADRNEVESLESNVYSKDEINKIISDYRKQGINVFMYDLSEFTSGVNNQDIDVLTESWITYINLIQE